MRLGRQLAWYVRNCLGSPAAHCLDIAALSQLDVLRGEVDDTDDEFLEPRVSKPRRKLRELHRLLYAIAGAPRGDQQFERNIAFARGEFRLDDIDTEILLLLLRYEEQPGDRGLCRSRIARNGAHGRGTDRRRSARHPWFDDRDRISICQQGDGHCLRDMRSNMT
jgi:hypothetical protein